ncbi:polyketide cyclase [Billgrantia diversa]|uniref:SRPBCC family protein n=1 Tax=Halomonas sp. MCCC 1A13316 TaxID=2733487 RepID=UPI0018A5F278|nr:SRPBCC family protein [Halomonas sp. MCCC 1A13316]QOR37757.1 polyketide cyclase [Halomonas sp. MCCC 1A13316]
MASFEFDTAWDLDAPIEAVFDALTDSLHWPDWWPGLEDVREIEAGDEHGIGRTQCFVWKSRLGYYLRFHIRITRVRSPWLIEGKASGDVAGIGSWQLHEQQKGTRIRYLWQVRTARPWMGLLARVARPLVVWNHHVMMREGRAGLARHLGTLPHSDARRRGLASRERW